MIFHGISCNLLFQFYIKKDFIKINGKWYFLNTNNSKGTEGSLYYGWRSNNGNWYYFDKAKGGAALTSTYKQIGKTVYKFNASGVCLNPYD